MYRCFSSERTCYLVHTEAKHALFESPAFRPSSLVISRDADDVIAADTPGPTGTTDNTGLSISLLTSRVVGGDHRSFINLKEIL
ncbi:hypothetical protein EVAR_70066_1, partial [Eumeta japonica]